MMFKSGAVKLRYQPDPEDYLNFFDIKAAAQVSRVRSTSTLGSSHSSGYGTFGLQEGGIARARACLFDPASGIGGWASVPLIKVLRLPLYRKCSGMWWHVTA